MDSTLQMKEWARVFREASHQFDWLQLPHGQALEIAVALTSEAASWTQFVATTPTPSLFQARGDRGCTPLFNAIMGRSAECRLSPHDNYFSVLDPALGRYTDSDPIGMTGGLGTCAERARATTHPSE